MATWSQMNIDIIQSADAVYSGHVLKAYEPGTTTPISIAIDENGGSPQATLTTNANGVFEVGGNEVLPYIDRYHKWALFANATDATNNTNPVLGFFDNVPASGSGGKTGNSSVSVVQDLRDLNPNAYTVGDTVYLSGRVNDGDFRVETGSTTDDGGVDITDTAWANASKFWRRMAANLDTKVDWWIADITAADLSSEINSAFAYAATTSGKVVSFSPGATYNITDTIGRTTAGAGGTVQEIYGNGAEIVFTGAANPGVAQLAVEFATDAPSIRGRLRISRAPVVGFWDDVKPGGDYDGTVAISMRLMRSKYWRDLYIEGFAFAVDHPLSGSISDRVTRCRFENIEISACLNGFNVFCANDGWMTETNYVDCRYAGALMKKGNYTITGATNANPVVVTATGHDFINGDIVEIINVAGMTEINGEFTAQNVTANTFELYSFTPDTQVASTAIDGTSYGTYTSGGEAFSLQGTFFRGYNDGSASSDAFPRAISFNNCVIERAKYAIRHNANGAGNTSFANFFENCPYNIHLEDINNNPNCNWDVFGDQDQSGEAIGTIDTSVQNHTQFGNRDIWIKSFLSLIETGGASTLGMQKTAEDTTAKGFTYKDGTAEIVNVDGNEPLRLSQTASGNRDFITLYRGATQLGEIGLDSSDNLVVRNFGANDIVVDIAANQGLQIQLNGALRFQFDGNATAGNTGLNIYSNSAGALRRVKQDTSHSAPGGGDYLYIDA